MYGGPEGSAQTQKPDPNIRIRVCLLADRSFACWDPRFHGLVVASSARFYSWFAVFCCGNDKPGREETLPPKDSCLCVIVL